MRRLTRWLMVGLLATSAGLAAPFESPPETSPLVPQGGWVTPFPYQRNALIDFATDPGTWPQDPNRTDARDLIPGVNVDLEGTDDPDLWPSDWFMWETTGDVEFGWLPVDPAVQTRTGVAHAVFGPQVPGTLDLTWHLDNWSRPGDVKHIYVELVWRTSDVGTMFLMTAPVGSIVETTFVDVANEGDGYRRGNWYVSVEPNPPWEEFGLSLYPVLAEPGPYEVWIDSIHIASECVVPEPGTVTLLGLAMVGLCRRRRR